MFLVHLMQYTFLASIAFDVAVGVWFVKNSVRLTNPIIRSYYVTFSLILIWEIVTYVSFFVQRSTSFNFIFNAGTFTFGLTALFSVVYFTWLFFEKKYLSKVVIYFFTLLTIVVAVTAYVPGLIVGQKVYSAEGPLFYLKSAPYSFILYGMAVIVLLLLIGLLSYGYRKSVGRKKVEAKLLIIGFGTASCIGVLTHVVVPLSANILLHSNDSVANSVAAQQIIGSVASSIISVTIAYAILRYRIFNIHYQIKRYAITASIYCIVLCTLGLILLKAFTFTTVINDITLAVVIVVAIFIGPAIKQAIDALIRRLVPAGVFDLYKLTVKEQMIMNALPSPAQTVSIALSHFIETIPVERMVLYGFDSRSDCFTSLYPNDGSKIDAHPDLSALTQQLKCVRLLPILYNQDVIAFFGIGPRINQQTFSQEDDSYITSFVRFIGPVLWNSLNLQTQVYIAIDRK